MANYNPSQVTHSYWVYALEQHIAQRFPDQDGKWMMFFPLAEMDARWAEACQLYRSGRLHGINSMKASTAQQNPMPERLHRYDEGILIFYCGPCEDEENVMEYGRNILDNMNYSRDDFYYKSDKPHLINYNKKYKHMYFINTKDHYSGAPRPAPAPRKEPRQARSQSSLDVYSPSAYRYDNQGPYARSASAMDFNRNDGLYGYSQSPQSNYNLPGAFSGYDAYGATPSPAAQAPATPDQSAYGNGFDNLGGGYGGYGGYGNSYGGMSGMGGYGGYGAGYGGMGGGYGGYGSYWAPFLCHSYSHIYGGFGVEI